jgi:nucleoside-diphosphate-sugar epimerase
VKNFLQTQAGKKVYVIHGEPRLGDVRRNYSDISKAKMILGYEPRFDLDRGLKQTFEYFRARDEF